MSGSARKRSSKWDFKEDFHHPREAAKGNDYSGKSGYFHEKDLELGHIHPEANGRNGSRRSAMDDGEQLRNKHEIRQHSGEPWPRVSRDGDGMIANYDTRKSSILDECRQQNSRQSPEKRIHRSRSRSVSRSRSRSWSRSPFHGVRRDSGFYDRRKNRPRVSPQSGRDFDGRYRRGVEHQSAHQGDQGDEVGWEAKSRKARDSKYYLPDDSRERPTRGGRSTEFITNFPEDNSRRETLGRHLHDGTSDGVVRRHRSDFIRERESHRRDGDAVLVNSCEGQVHKNSDIPCKFFAAGYCRNGNYCRFSHHVATRRSPDRRPYDDRFRQDSNRSETEKFYNSRKWNVEISDTGKSSGVGTNSVNAGTSEPKVNGNWLDDMEMSPDWNYGVQSLNNALKEENGHVAQSLQSLDLKDSLVVAHKHGDIKEGWKHGSTGIAQNLVTENCYVQQDRSHQDANLYSHNGDIMVEKPLSSNYDPNNLVNIAPVQSFNQNSQNHGALPYESSAPLCGSQMPTTIDHSGGLGLSNSENVKVFQESNTKGKPTFGDLEPSKVNAENFTTQNTVTRDQLSQISNISASLVQLFGNGQQLPQLYSTLTPQNAMQPALHTNSEGYVKPESLVVVQPNQATGLQAHNDPMSNCVPSKGHETGTGSEGAPVVTAAAQINMTDAQQRQVPDNSVSSALLHTSSETGRADRSHEPAGNPKASKENSDKKADESKRWQDEKNTNGENEDVENAEGDEKADENKKGKDPKGMRAFKFALVEIVKELLKPAWKEGRMGRDAYKNIVKKVVDKVTGTMQGGNPPQTQEKIDHYLSSSKPKLTKLVQAYVNKYQKS